jgi:hypothetical protein
MYVGPTLVTAPFARPRDSGAESAERDTQYFFYQLVMSSGDSVSDFFGGAAPTSSLVSLPRSLNKGHHRDLFDMANAP